MAPAVPFAVLAWRDHQSWRSSCQAGPADLRIEIDPARPNLRLIVRHDRGMLDSGFGHLAKPGRRTGYGSRFA